MGSLAAFSLCSGFEMKPSDWVFVAILAGIALVGFLSFQRVASKASGSSTSPTGSDTSASTDATAAVAAGGHTVAGFYTQPGSFADSLVSFFEGF